MKHSIIFTIAICAIIYKGFVASERILVVIPSHAYSHQQIFFPILRELSKRGHELVVITPFPMNDTSLKNYTEIGIGHLISPISEYNFIELRRTTSWIEAHDLIRKIAFKVSNEILSYPVIQRMYAPDSKEKFDLLITEYLAYYPLYGFAHRFGVPIVGITTLPTFQYLEYSVGLPILPSHPSNWELKDGTGINLPFLQRLKNYVIMWQYLHMWNTQYIPYLDKLSKKCFGADTPYIEEIQKNVTLVLANRNNVISFPKLEVPKVIYVNGIFTFKSNVIHKLSKDLKAFLDDAVDGFIYVSFGTNIRSASLPLHIKNVMFQVLTNIPWKVVWKYEASLQDLEMLKKSKNIFISKWFPQRSILSHPNIKLFIYHGGYHSTEEATFYGVPLLGLPIMADQDVIVRRMVAIGVAKSLEITKLSNSEMDADIHEIIKNKRYKQNMLQASRILKDNPHDALEQSVWWIEHVLRHKGVSYLHYSVADEPWYQRYDLDVICFLAIIVFSSLLLAFLFTIKVIIYMYRFQNNIHPSNIKTKIS